MTKKPNRVLRSWALRDIAGVEALTEAEIVDAAIPYKRHCGIYFLIMSGKVCYVGQAVDVAARVGIHWREKGPFDSVAIIACDARNLDVVESFYIHRLKPPWNGRNKAGCLCAPLSETDLYKTRWKPIEGKEST